MTINSHFWKWWLKWVVSGWEASTQGSGKSSQMALVRGYCLLKGPLRLVAPFGRLWKRCSFPWHPDDWLPGSCVAWNGLFCTSRSLLPILIPSHKSASHRQAHRLWLSLLAKRSRWRYDELCRSLRDQPPTPNATHLRHLPLLPSFLSSEAEPRQHLDRGCADSGAGRLTGLRLLPVKKKKKKGKEQVSMLPRAHYNHVRKSRQGQQHTLSQLIWLFPPFHLHFF